MVQLDQGLHLHVLLTSLTLFSVLQLIFPEFTHGPIAVTTLSPEGGVLAGTADIVNKKRDKDHDGHPAGKRLIVNLQCQDGGEHHGRSVILEC